MHFALTHCSSADDGSHLDAGWSSSVARWAHNPEVVGSNPAPATNFQPPTSGNAGGGLCISRVKLESLRKVSRLPTMRQKICSPR